MGKAIKSFSSSHMLSSCPNIPGFLCAQLLKATGYLSTELATCAGALYSLSEAFNMIHNGEAEIGIIGGSNCKTDLLEQLKFRLLGYNREDEYAVLDGAGVILLESEHSIKKSARPILAEVLGSGVSFSPNTHENRQLDEISISYCIDACLKHSGFYNKEKLSYLPGSFQKQFLEIETRIVNRVLPHADINTPFKSRVGHSFAASGIAEIVDIFESGENHERVKNIVVASWGIGGHNVCIGLERW